MSLKEKHKNKKKRRHSNDSGSESEHELFHYANDRVRLMKEVLKILKLKKIKSLAPDGIKNMDMEEINTLLLEELLGISNKRLKKILDGQNADDESSSSDEDKVVDIISLDSISDDEICFVDETKDSNNHSNRKHVKSKHKRHKVKKEPEGPSIKTEQKQDKEREKKNKNKAVEGKSEVSGLENEKLLSVLELLELQARARAIRSQLALEAETKAKEKQTEVTHVIHPSDDDDDAVVIETPQVNEIVISSSDSEAENVCEKKKTVEDKATTSKTLQKDAETTISSILQEENDNQAAKKPQKIKLIRNVLVDTSSIPLPEKAPVEEKTKESIENVANNTENTDKSESDKEITHVSEKNKTEMSNNEGDGCKDEVEVKLIEDMPKQNETSNKRRPTVDLDDDVVRIDIVEIDGIDD